MRVARAISPCRWRVEPGSGSGVAGDACRTVPEETIGLELVSQSGGRVGKKARVDQSLKTSVHDAPVVAARNAVESPQTGSVADRCQPCEAQPVTELVENNGHEVILTGRRIAISPVVPVGERAVEIRADVTERWLEIDPGTRVRQRREIPGIGFGRTGEIADHVRRARRSQHVRSERRELRVDDDGHRARNQVGPDIDRRLKRGLRLRSETGVGHDERGGGVRSESTATGHELPPMCTSHAECRSAGPAEPRQSRAVPLPAQPGAREGTTRREGSADRGTAAHESAWA